MIYDRTADSLKAVRESLKNRTNIAHGPLVRFHRMIRREFPFCSMRAGVDVIQFPGIGKAGCYK